MKLNKYMIIIILFLPISLFSSWTPSFGNPAGNQETLTNFAKYDKSITYNSDTNEITIKNSPPTYLLPCLGIGSIAVVGLGVYGIKYNWGKLMNAGQDGILMGLHDAWLASRGLKGSVAAVGLGAVGTIATAAMISELNQTYLTINNDGLKVSDLPIIPWNKVLSIQRKITSQSSDNIEITYNDSDKNVIIAPFMTKLSTAEMLQIINEYFPITMKNSHKKDSCSPEEIHNLADCYENLNYYENLDGTTAVIGYNCSGLLKSLPIGFGALCIGGGICGLALDKRPEAIAPASAACVVGLLSGYLGYTYTKKFLDYGYLTINAEGIKLRNNNIVKWDSIRDIQCTHGTTQDGSEILCRIDVIDKKFDIACTIAYPLPTDIPLSDILKIIDFYMPTQDATLKNY